MLSQFWNSIAGLPPGTIAAIFAIGVVLGVFPVYGCATVFCAVVAVLFRLNLPAIQLINQICVPLQLALLVPLGRAGERVLGAGGPGHPVVWNLADATLNAVVGWCCFCVPLGLVFYVILAFALRRRRQGQISVLENFA